MTTPRRYKNGITNVAAGNTLAAFIDTDPTKVVTFWDDFMPYTAADWVKTATSVGAGTSAAAQSDSYVGGAVVITNAANEDDSLWLQHSHDGGINDLEGWRIQAGKKAWFKAKFQGVDVDQTDFMVGIHIAATDPIDTPPTDGIWFHSPDESADIHIHCVKDSVYTSASSIGTMVDATDITVGFYWDGVDTIHYFVDDVEQGTLSSGTIPDDEYLSVSFGCQNGEAIANTMTTDFIFSAMER